MKKKTLNLIFPIAIFFILILPVYADTCPSPIIDNQAGDSRELSCDATSQKVTKFRYPQAGDVQVFKNDLCTIKCSEDLALGADPIKHVKAGMGFNYPLYVSGQRTCSATYDYQGFDTDLRDLVAKRDAETKGSAQYQTFINQISNMLQTKDDCDNWKDTDGKYSMNPNISLRIYTSENYTDITYVPKTKYSSTPTNNTTSYSSCDLKDKADNPCTENTSTVMGWGEVARIDGRYSMADRIIEKYTGKEVTEESSNTCKASDVFFTSFYEKTKPVSGDLIDKGYTLTLTANNMGNNILAAGNKWDLKVNCWYTVDNLIFPQTTDDNYSKYGNTGFLYRIIDLADPFPERNPGENWAGKTDWIKSTIDRNKDVEYTITLNAGTIRELQDYNSHNSYDAFDLNSTEKSNFIESHPDIVKRGQ